MNPNNIDFINLLYGYYEVEGQKKINAVFKGIYEEIENTFDVKYQFPKYIEKDEDVYFFKGYAAVYDNIFSKNSPQVLDILKKCKFYFPSFIKDFIKELGNLDNPNKNKASIKKYLRLPFINDCIFDGKTTFTIDTSYGEYIFYLASVVLDDSEVIEYLKSGNRKNECHANATYLLKHYIDLYSITSLCQHYLDGTYYYHSYGYKEDEDLVIDLCSNMVMDKKSYDFLFGAKEVMFLDNISLYDFMIDKVLDIKTSLEACDYFKIALYFQYLNLQDNPDEMKKILLYNDTINNK